MTEENKGKVQQMRLKMKFQRSVSIIKEEVSDVESENEDSEESVESQKEPAEDEAEAENTMENKSEV